MSWQRLVKLLYIGLLSGNVVIWVTGCSSSAANSSAFFGVTSPPAGQVFRYVTGSEPESLDPHLSTGQPEARIYMALFEGLTEYDPKTLKPIPAVAERWESNKELSEYTFYLRKNARWSDGTPITAADFVYSLRRGLNPETASPTAELAYYIKYAEAYNSGRVFVRDPATNRFLLEKDFKRGADLVEGEPSPTPEASPTPKPVRKPKPAEEKPDAPPKPTETEFHKFIAGDTRLTVSADEAARKKEASLSLKLQRELPGKELVPVKAEDVGVEAVDNYTVRITLNQSAPFFLASTPHQFFRLVPKKAIEKFGDNWTQPENMVTCGPFKLKEWLPYNRLVVEKDPGYWDAGKVKLERIEFYPLEDNPTIMNLYKTGEIDAALNHSVPTSWLGEISKYKDYMKMPEVANDFYKINTTRAPMDKVEVRKAFNLAIDKNAYAAWRKTVLPLTAFTPEGAFAGYPQPRGDQFNPNEAKRLLASAGFRDTVGNYDVTKFPISEVEIIYNTHDTNKAIAEFVQAQWKQNLGITVPIRAMEWKTFLATIKKLDYKGFARGGWIGDYVDPYTFLGLFYNQNSNSDTGWYDMAYTQMLDEANRQLDGKKRYELLARAEAYLLNAQPFVSLSTPSTNFMKKPYVKGMYPNPGSLYAWKFVYIAAKESDWDNEPPKITE